MLECDVLVVGAGPAGSSAARAAALNGAKTIFIDKKKEVGIPVQCAEGIGRYLLPYLPFKIPSKLLKWPIEGISFWADDITIERKGENWAGYSINRDEFDKWLADKAIKAGANLMLRTELLDLEIEGDYNVKKATVKTPHGNKEIIPKVVIAADGVDSTVLKLLGFKIQLEKNAGYVLGYEIDKADLKKPHYEQIFMGNFAPGGYGYVFPKSRTVANVGVAVLSQNEKIKNFFEQFIDFLGIDSYDIIIEKSGIVPFLNQTKHWKYGNVLLAGDTANHNIKPFVEGILPSVLCGNIAGNISTEPKNFDSYVKEVIRIFGEIWDYSNIFNKIIYDLRNPDPKNDLIKLGLISNIFNLSNYNILKEYNNERLKNKIEENI